MARRSSIRLKLISASTLLLIVVMGMFATMSTLQSRRLIDDATEQIRSSCTTQMRRAGRGNFRLLAESIRIAILQTDMATLQSTVHNVAKNDDNITSVATADASGVILAHSDKKMVGKEASGLLKRALEVDQLTVEKAKVGKQPSMVFMGTVSQGSEKLGAITLSYSLRPLQKQLEAAEERKKREVAANLRNIAIVGLLSMMVGVLLTVFQGMRITRPIKELSQQAERIAAGDLKVRADVTSNDEIGSLAGRFNYMAEQVESLLQAEGEKATLEKELELARVIQATLIPDTASVDLCGLSLAGYFSTATQCGGDWWGYFSLIDDRTLVMIGDVTGHGVGPAMITAAAKGAVSSTMAVTEGRATLEALLNAMNIAIRASAQGQYVMTCFAALYDPRQHILDYANAGHNFPYIYYSEQKKLSNLVVRGNRLGDVANAAFEVKQINVSPDDLLVLYTDGLVECEDPRGEEFGERRFRALIRKHVESAPATARDEIIHRAHGFYGEVPQKDDITLVIGKIT